MAIHSKYLETLQAILGTALNIVKSRMLADLYVRREYTGDFRVRVKLDNGDRYSSLSRRRARRGGAPVRRLHARAEFNTRAIQDYLGHRSIASTVRYTALGAGPLKASGRTEGPTRARTKKAHVGRVLAIDRWPR